MCMRLCAGVLMFIIRSKSAKSAPVEASLMEDLSVSRMSSRSV